jgi:hypothetical protein
MAQRGSQQGTTRFRGPTEVSLRGAGSSGNEAQQIGAGTQIGFRIAVPLSQTAAAFTIEKPEGTVIYSIDANGGAQKTPSVIAASGALPVVAGSYVITAASAVALTLAAPVAGTQDGLTISISSATAFAHTITATGLLQTGTAAVNVVTFAAFAGASVTLRAYNGKWQVTAGVAVTYS